MKALNFDGKELSIADKQIPKRDTGEALIKVRYAGICNTDLEILKGYMGFVGTLGHEFVGVVEEANNSTLIGKRVVGEINLACGSCDMCMKGMGRHCPNRNVLGIAGKDGSMAEYLTMPERNLHVVPQAIPDTKAVFTEPLAAACEITEQLQILPEYKILVIGDGKLAQLIAQVLSLYTDKLLVVGKHQEKLELLEPLNISTVLLEELNDNDQSFQVVVEATGDWTGWEMAVQKVEPRGFLVLKSTFAESHQFNPAPLVINEVNVIGSRCGPFTIALQLLRKGVVETQDLVSNTFPFSQWQQAFKFAEKSDSLKVLLEFE